MDLYSGTTTLSSSDSDNINIYGASTLNLGIHTTDTINVSSTGTGLFTLNNSTADTINLSSGTNTLLGTAGGNDTITGSFGTDTIDLGSHTHGDEIYFPGDLLASDSPYSLHYVTGAVIGTGSLSTQDHFHFTDATGTALVSPGIVNLTGDWVENGTVLGTNEMWSQAGGLIKFTTGDLNHTIQTPTHHGAVLANEIMSVLEFNWATAANTLLEAYIDIEGGKINTWIFEATSKTTGVVVELVGVNATAGLNDSAAAVFHAVNVA